MLVSLVNLFETVCVDGRCGNQHTDLRYLYLTLAALEARHGNDLAQALAYFEKGFEHHKEYCRISTDAYSYTSPLVAKFSLEKGQFQNSPENFWGLTMPQFSDEFQRILKKNKKFQECFE